MDKDHVHNHPILDFVDVSIYSEFSLQTNIAAEEMLVSTGSFEQSKQLSKLLREAAGGKLARGLQYKLLRAHGLVIGVHEDRTLKLDLTAAKMAEFGMLTAIVQLSANEYGFRYAVFCSRDKDLIDRVVERAKEKGLSCEDHRPPTAGHVATEEATNSREE